MYVCRRLEPDARVPAFDYNYRKKQTHHQRNKKTDDQIASSKKIQAV